MTAQGLKTKKGSILLLSRLLMLQMAYCFTGIMYNVGSLLAQRSGLPAWARS
jgi:hypothetical protein